jgi:hypothetical protein
MCFAVLALFDFVCDSTVKLMVGYTCQILDRICKTFDFELSEVLPWEGIALSRLCALTVHLNNRNVERTSATYDFESVIAKTADSEDSSTNTHTEWISDF